MTIIVSEEYSLQSVIAHYLEGRSTEQGKETCFKSHKATVTKLEMAFQIISSQTTTYKTFLISYLHCFVDDLTGWWKKKRRVQMKKKQLGIIEEGSFQKDDT